MRRDIHIALIILSFQSYDLFIALSVSIHDDFTKFGEKDLKI